MRALIACFAFFIMLPLLASGGENLSSEVLLASHGDTDAHAPAAAFGKDVYLVVWQAGRNEKADIVGLRLDKSGKPLDAKPFVISGAKDCQERPKVAFGGNIFLVVWQDLRNEKDYDVYAARVSPEGKVLDPEGIAVSAEKRNQAQPAVCFDGTCFQLLWRDNHQLGHAYEIYGNRMSPEGRLLDGSGVLVQTAFSSFGGALYMGVPAVGSTGAGATVAATKGGLKFPNLDNISVWPMQGGKQTAKPLDDVYKGPADSGTWGHRYVWDPAFASDGQKLLMCFGTFRPIGRGGCCWDSGAVLLPADLKGVPTDLIAVSSEKRGKNLSRIRNPAPAWDGTSYVVAWDMFVYNRDAKVGPHDAVFLRRISREGVPQDVNTPVAGEPASSAFRPAAASDGAGTTLVAYERHPKTGDVPIKIGYRLLRAK